MTRKPPARLGVITKPHEPRACTVARLIAEWTLTRGVDIVVDNRICDLPQWIRLAPHETIGELSDLLISLGGDGTMIAAARLVAGRGTPVLGINLGSLGYLPEFSVEDAIPALEWAMSGEYEIDTRTMLDWTIMRGDASFAHGSVLNDVVVNKATVARIIDIDCSIGKFYVTTFRGDGLIIATPTGSTAYNLSAGGPIIYPNANVISVAPICPHTLTNRPVILPDSVEITLQLATREQEVMLTSDGQIGVPLVAGDRIIIRRSSKQFNMVRPKDRDYFSVLRGKLKWSGR